MDRTTLFAVFVIVILLYSPYNLPIQSVGKASSANAQVVINTPPAGALIVPDKYPTIQAAIGNASAGDTVFVKAGTYNVDTIVIDKAISLIGEDANNTIIDGRLNYYNNWGWQTIAIESSNVKISGFTIKNCPDSGISINYFDQQRCSKIAITGNIFVNNGGASIIDGGYRNDSDILISGNYFSNSSEGISISGVNCVISNNVISQSALGILVFQTENLNINNNNVFNNSFGISLAECSNTDIYQNTLTSNTGFNAKPNWMRF